MVFDTEKKNKYCVTAINYCDQIARKNSKIKYQPKLKFLKFLILF